MYIEQNLPKAIDKMVFVFSCGAFPRLLDQSRLLEFCEHIKVRMRRKSHLSTTVLRVVALVWSKDAEDCFVRSYYDGRG